MQPLPASAVSPPQSLDYAPAPSRRRKWMIRAAAIALLLAMGYLAARWGPLAWRKGRLLYWQHQCLTYSPGAQEVVYEEEPAAAALLLARSRDHAPYPLNRSTSPRLSSPVLAAARVPACWTEFGRLSGTTAVQAGSGAGAIVFLHERVSPSGNRRLVFLRYFPESQTFTSTFIAGYNVEQGALTPADLTHPVSFTPKAYAIDVLSGWPRHPPEVRMYAGQPDPQDPAHFTVRYRMWGREDIIDGRLDDQDTVTLIPRHPPHD